MCCVEVSPVLSPPSQELTQLKTEVGRHKRTIKKLEEGGGAAPTMRENKPLASKN